MLLTTSLSKQQIVFFLCVKIHLESASVYASESDSDASDIPNSGFPNPEKNFVNIYYVN